VTAALPARRPFRQLPFAALPELPRRPHPYYDEPLREVVMETAPWGSIPVAWRQHGSGPPLLLVHGLMTSSYSWRYVLEPLGRRFTLFAPDLPGSGASGKPPGPYDPGSVATWIGQFQSLVGIRGCPVIGNSLGGYLCMRLALDDPASMSRLLNLHSPGLPEPRIRALGAALSVPGVQRALAAFVRRDPHRWAHTHVHYFDETLKSLQEARAYGDPLADVAGSRAFARILAETVHWRPMRDQLARLHASDGFPVPLLLLYARADPMVPPRIGAALAAATGAELRWLEEGSHFAHVDAPDAFVAEALEFLGG